MMKSENEFGSFFLPGPTEVRREVLAAMLGPMIPHRSAEFEDLFARLQSGLRKLFLTDRPVFIAASSGTGMMEAGIRALPEGPILCLVNGAFSERFAHIGEMCGREVTRYEVPWGQVHDLEELDKYLSNRQFRAITATHSETSTGALTDIKRVSDVAHQHGALCLIDSVSGAGGAELRFDDWKLDYVLTGSQKALALPPGLAFGIASKEVVELASQSKNRGVYFDLVEMEKFAKGNQVPATPAFSLMYALDVQLASIAAEGVEARWRRHTDMLTATEQWIEESAARTGKKWRIFVDKGSRSPTVSTIELPSGITGKAFVERVKQQGVRVATGYGKLGESTFRIGHMGDHTVATLQNCFNACEEAISG